MGEVVQQMRKGEQAVGGVKTISAASVAALEAIVKAAAEVTGYANRIAETTVERTGRRLAGRARGAAEFAAEPQRGRGDRVENGGAGAGFAGAGAVARRFASA
jgi:hypothetical protein